MLNCQWQMKNDKQKDIYRRIYTFVLNILDLVKEIPSTTENIIIIKQLIRSASSIGANANEADGAESKKEFIHRLTISKKEAKETQYWLSLLSDHNTALKLKLEPALDEISQLIAIISKIIINTKNNLEIKYNT